MAGAKPSIEHAIQRQTCKRKTLLRKLRTLRGQVLGRQAKHHCGVMDSLIVPWVNASTMSMFLSSVAQRHPDAYIVMVMDQAGWHMA
jgi:hypothetical protein